MTTLLALTLAAGAFALPVDHYARQSKLAQGTWVRLVVDESGVYELSAQDLSLMGLGDLEQVRVFGRGGAPMSEYITADIPDDLPQVPTYRHNGKLYFYAQGPLTWKSGTGIAFTQVQHPYATQAYYFLTNDTAYARTDIPRSTAVPEGDVVNSFTERVFHETELTNAGESGRTLLGEDFLTTDSLHLKFNLPGWVEGTEVQALTAFAAKVTSGSFTLTFKQNNINLPLVEATDRTSSTQNDEHDFFKLLTPVKKFVPESSTIDYAIKGKLSGGASMLRLDYVTLNYQRTLRLTDAMLRFTAGRDGGTPVTYEVSGCGEQAQVWDVTDPMHPVSMNTVREGDVLRFSPSASGPRDYVAFDPAKTLLQPSNDGKVRNQNIHGEATPDMIIVTSQRLINEARRLASHRESLDSLRVLVVEQQQVYNEFSSGTPDAMALRMLCKMMWDRGVDTTGHRLKYLLLMGDGFFDNRGISIEAKGLDKALVVTWQSEASNNENQSFTSDDFFAALGDDNGSQVDFYAMEQSIAVGRLPVGNTTEARTMVDKIIKYDTNPDMGVWKNTVLSVADDQDNATHMRQAEKVIELLRQNGGDAMMYTHVFIDAFPEQTVMGTRTYPQAKELMLNTLKEGTMWWTYTGHASPNNWGSEGMLRRSDITDNLYYDHLPALYAATCEFARFDAIKESGTENMVLNGRGGVIAAICPCRLVYMDRNGLFGESLAKYMLALDANSRSYTMGDIVRMGKNDVIRSSASALQAANDSKFCLLGDPALRLSRPTNKVVIQTINGAPADSTKRPVFKARQTITMTGKVCDSKGRQLTDFNGNVKAVLYDSEQSVITHGYGDNGREFTYLDRLNKLAITVDSVSAGSFTLRMTIPSELVATFENYSPALVNLYASDSETKREASGSNTDFYIYGYDDTAPADSVGPDIEFLCLNTRSFVEGEAVNESPLVLASISDPNGLNFSSAGVGHTMSLLLDNKVTYSDLAGYYMPEQTDVGTLGSLRYPLKNLSAGYHTLRLRVWDVFNNMSEKTISFNVSQGAKPELVDVHVSENPARESVTFYVEHNRPDANMSMTIEVYDLMGRPVWSTTQSGKSTMFMSFPVAWNLVGHDGRRVPRGIYVFRASISTDGEYYVSKAKKLAVCAQ